MVCRQSGSLDAVIADLAKKMDTVMFKVSIKIDPFHEMSARAHG